MEPPISADPWDTEIDSYDAALILGVTVNNLRQMVFKKKIEVVGHKKRRAIFRRDDVIKLKSERMKELKVISEPIGVSQADLPQDE